jgi:hypothetical protein
MYALFSWMFLLIQSKCLCIGGASDALFRELWHACAGPLVTVPRQGELVYYFPQGHMEQVYLNWCTTIEELSVFLHSLAINIVIILLVPYVRITVVCSAAMQLIFVFCHSTDDQKSFYSLKHLQISNLTSTYLCLIYHPRSCARW